MTEDEVLHALFPQLKGLSVDQVEVGGDAVQLKAATHTTRAACPDCGQHSAQVHGQYTRRLADMSAGGRAVRIDLQVRRFRCSSSSCPRRTFVEQVENLTARYQRRSVLLRRVLEAIAVSLAGRAGARLAARLAVAVSRSSMLRLLRGLPDPEPSGEMLTAVGIDDFALRRGHVYATLVIDMATHQPIDVLPDRTSATVAAWLKAHPGIEVICRDRAGAYADGARTGAPDAVQVADRWHLWHNLAEAVEDLVVRHRMVLRAASQPETDGDDDEKPDIVADFRDASETGTGSSQQPQETFLIPPGRLATRTNERHAAVHELLAANASISSISRQLRLDRHTVRRFARAAEPEHLIGARDERESILDPFKPYLHQRWNDGITDAARLTREIIDRGYRGSGATVRRYLGPLRASQRPAPREVHPPATIREVTGWLTRRPEDLTEADSRVLHRIMDRVPVLATAYDQVREFAKMLTQLRGHELPDWLARIDREGEPELKSFVIGVRRDLAAVTAGMTLRYSSGAVEGNVTRVKALKRQMYGRAGLDLLRKRILLPN
jgi:transposase